MTKRVIMSLAASLIFVFLFGCSKETAPYGYTKTGSQKIENVAVSHFTGNVKEDKARTDFTKWLKDDGWVLDHSSGDIEIAGYTGDIFKKKNDLMVLSINTSGDRAYISLASAPAQSVMTTQKTTILNIPDETDVEGSDIDDIPRYPGSIRILYEEEINVYGYITVEYITKDSLDDIKVFYEEFLDDDDWEDPDMIFRGNTLHIQGLRDSFFVMITAEPSSLYDGYNQIRTHIQGIFE